MVDIGLYAAYGLILLAIVLVIGFNAFNTLKNPEEAKSSLVKVGVLAVVFLIAYLVAPSEFYFSGIEKYKLGAQQIKLVGAGLNTFFILGALGIIAAVYAEVSSMIK